MKDFTLDAYKNYLQLIKASYSNIFRFDEFFELNTQPESFILIRHDVDRRPNKALQMALIEKEMDIRSTYYFRAKKNVFKSKIIRKIHDLDHEIGYHYESLSDTDGDINLALSDFEANLERFRQFVPIKTISMHGRPFSPYDNRDMWRDPVHKEKLKNSFCILGEVYLDIDYRDIAYINDTGRNWKSDKANIRDKVVSNLTTDIKNNKQLSDCFEKRQWPKIIFQVHPERWAQNDLEYFVRYLTDNTINLLKSFI